MILPNVAPNDWNQLNYVLRLVDERLSEISGIHGRLDFRQASTAQAQADADEELPRFDQIVSTSNFVPVTRVLTAGAGLAGGGDLSADRAFAVNVGDGIEIVADSVTADVGTGLTLSGGEVVLADTAVVAGAYTSANITIDAQGRITAAANGLALGDIDRLTSQVGAGSTLILTDDNTDMTLTGDTGNLILTPAGGTVEVTQNFKFGGSITAGATTVTAAAHTAGNHYYHFCNATANQITVTLPAIANTEGLTYSFKKIDSTTNRVVIDGSGAETIDDAATRPLIARYETVKVASDGTDWHVVEGDLSVREARVISGGSSAVNHAIAELNTLGGGVVRLDGLIEMDGDITMMSNVTLAAHGPRTGLRNSTANAYAINFVGTTPTYYGIAAPVHGASTITTDVAADAGNFSEDDYFIVKDNTGANGAAVHFGRVQADGVAATGVIAMSEDILNTTLYFTAGSQAAPLTAPVKEAGLQFMDILNDGAGSITINIQYAADINIERCHFSECFMEVDQSGYVHVTGCLFDIEDDNAHSAHLAVKDWVAYLYVIDCTFKNAAQNMNWTGTTSALMGIEVTNCRFYGGQFGIYWICIGGQAKSSIFACKIEGCMFLNGQAGTYAFQSTANVWNSSINNNVTEREAQAVYIVPSHSCAFNNICGNIIKSALTLYKQNNLNLSNNYLGNILSFSRGLANSTVVSNTVVGQALFIDSGNQSVVNNTITGNYFNGNITFEGDAVYICRENIFTSNWASGTFLMYGIAPDNTIANNYFAGAVNLTNGAGQDLDRLTFVNNNCAGNVTFSETDHDDCVIMGNIIGGTITRLTGTGNREDGYQWVTSVTSADSPYTVLATDFLITCDTSGGAITVDLPAVSGLVGREYVVKVTDATNAVTIDGNGAETIDGGATLVLNSVYDAAHLICDSSEWSII